MIKAERTLLGVLYHKKQTGFKDAPEMDRVNLVYD
jgi:hypothetical protein